MTSGQPPDCHDRPAAGAMLGDGLDGIRRAARIEAAGPAEHRGYQFLVDPKDRDEHDFHCCTPAVRRSDVRTASSRARYGTAVTSGVAVMTRSTSPSGAAASTAARSRRFTRFRVVADPTRRPTASPSRTPEPGGAGAAYTVTPSRRALRPSSRTRRNAAAPESERRRVIGCVCQAERRARPLSRLLFRIARPARVFIRALNPCLRLRLRLLGWNVRFVNSPSSK